MTMGNPFNIILPTEFPKKSDSFDVAGSKNWVNSLPARNNGKRAQLLFNALKEVIYTKFSATEKLDFLENIRDEVSRVCTIFATHYVDKPAPLPDIARRLSGLSIEFYFKLSLAYTQSLAALLEENTLFKKHTDKVLLALTRAMNYLNKAMLHAYKSHLPVPRHIWLNTHCLYQYTQRIKHSNSGFLNRSLNSKLLPIEDSYKQALLLSQSNPYGLSGSEIKKVYFWLLNESSYCLIEPKKQWLPSQENGVIALAINSDSDAPPCPIFIKDEQEWAAVDYIIDASELLARLGKKLKKVEHKKNLSRSDDVLLVRKLKKAWRGFVSRHHEREHDRVSKQVSVITGLETICSMLDDLFKRVSKKNHLSTGTEDTHQSVVSEMVCPILDESSKGCRLQWVANSRIKAVTGGLVAFNANVSQNGITPWKIGVIRWIRSKGAHASEVGVEFFMVDAINALVTVLNEEGRESQFEIHCLRVAGISEEKILPSLITPPFIARLDCRLRLEYVGKKGFESDVIELVRMKESTKYFSYFEYKKYGDDDHSNIYTVVSSDNVAEEKRAESEESDKASNKYADLWDVV